MTRTNEEMKLWLFDLAHGNLDDTTILSGFIRHYVLHGLTTGNVIDDILFHTAYGMPGIETAKNSLLCVLQKAAESDRKEGTA